MLHTMNKHLRNSLLAIVLWGGGTLAAEMIVDKIRHKPTEPDITDIEPKTPEQEQHIKEFQLGLKEHVMNVGVATRESYVKALRAIGISPEELEPDFDIAPMEDKDFKGGMLGGAMTNASASFAKANGGEITPAELDSYARKMGAQIRTHADGNECEMHSATGTAPRTATFKIRRVSYWAKAWVASAGSHQVLKVEIRVAE